MHRRVVVIALDPEIFSMSVTTCVSYRGIGVIGQVRWALKRACLKHTRMITIMILFFENNDI